MCAGYSLERCHDSDCYLSSRIPMRRSGSDSYSLISRPYCPSFPFRLRALVVLGLWSLPTMYSHVLFEILDRFFGL